MYYIVFLIFLLKITSISYSWRLQARYQLSPLRSRFSAKITPSATSADHTHSPEPEELLDLNEKNVENVLDIIRPQLALDGGGVKLERIVDNHVYVKFTGACVGCPYRSVTVKGGIESTLVRFLKSPNDNPIKVELVQDDD
ncbi:hypothetical protein BEWA_034270 [Theileria equi strain WA]|uniref:NIF system FeS cluster assembly NifU C-terminal domain-containing protein n=1 Tax=Theileria equi strain WA TaxID=1537102 RepID=L0AYC6_THEEQ|nr:hypothetical protein BEWA_034270 [Theileria equi strain WA]AFZ80570.1 hypothetical protein BEWA_034270 [Theileria equi strain WA]|eukprot:XP_004830236.1 hypothetical protein BEWA_034270 [Theileria equi strain WA]